MIRFLVRVAVLIAGCFLVIFGGGFWLVFVEMSHQQWLDTGMRPEVKSWITVLLGIPPSVGITLVFWALVPVFEWLEDAVEQACR